LGALVLNALFPLDAISGRKLLYSNPRLLRSSQLGETCPPNSDAEQRGLLGRWPGLDFGAATDAGPATDSKAAPEETACWRLP